MTNKMKFFGRPLMLLVIVVSLFSCQKEKADPTPSTPPPPVTPPPPTVNWSEVLKNTYWIGEYERTTFKYKGKQPFCIYLTADGKVTWTDFIDTRSAGTWSVNKDTVTILYPNKLGFTAVVSENGWSNIKYLPYADFAISKIEKTSNYTASSLVGVAWNGTIRGMSARIIITSATKLQYAFNNGTNKEISYTLEGAGIRFNINWNLYEADYFYAVFDTQKKQLLGLENHVTLSEDSFSIWQLPKI